MEYSKFSLGLRFAMTSDSNLTPNDCWTITFSEVPLTNVVGATLFGAWDDVGAADSETAYICMFSNLPLKKGKALFAQLLQKPVLLSYLTICFVLMSIPTGLFSNANTLSGTSLT